jgi:hypothetical protein
MTYLISTKWNKIASTKFRGCQILEFSRVLNFADDQILDFINALIFLLQYRFVAISIHTKHFNITTYKKTTKVGNIFF